MAALLVTGLAILGMWSIGSFIAPAVALLLGAAVSTQLAGSREEVQQAIVADPPARQEATRKTATGIGVVAFGAGLVYVGAITRELFGPRGRGTLECALAQTCRGGIGATLLGLSAVGFGAWRVWKQISNARALASN